MWIEIAGLPASGKSTVLTSVQQSLGATELRECQVNALEVAEARSKTIPGYVNRNLAARITYRTEQFRRKYPDMMAVTDPLFGQDFIAASLLMMVARLHRLYKAHGRNTDFIVIDEGFVHRGIHGICKYRECDAELNRAYRDVGLSGTIYPHKG